MLKLMCMRAAPGASAESIGSALSSAPSAGRGRRYTHSNRTMSQQLVDTVIADEGLQNDVRMLACRLEHALQLSCCAVDSAAILHTQCKGTVLSSCAHCTWAC